VIGLEALSGFSDVPVIRANVGRLELTFARTEVATVAPWLAGVVLGLADFGAELPVREYVQPPWTRGYRWTHSAWRIAEAASLEMAVAMARRLVLLRGLNPADAALEGARRFGAPVPDVLAAVGGAP
jgi:hypothetical protein